MVSLIVNVVTVMIGVMVTSDDKRFLVNEKTIK